MIYVDLIFAVIICLLCIYLGSIVLLSNKKKLANISFFLASLFASFWVISIYFTENTQLTLAANNLGNKSAYLFAYLSVMCLSIFTYFFSGIKLKVTQEIFIISFLIFGLIVSLLPGTGGQVTKDATGSLVFTNGPNIYLYLYIMIIVALWGISNLLNVYIKGRGKIRIQANMILSGFIITFSLTLFTNILLPIFVKDWKFAKYAPVFVLFILSFSSYAILKNSLFDIRPTIARLSGYILSFGALFIMLSSALLLASRFIFDQRISILQEVFFAVLIIISAFLFQFIKKYFDSLTSRIFFQDDYSSQQSLNELNAGLVSSSKIEELINSANDIFSKSLKPVSSGIVLDGENNNYRSNDFDLNDRLIQKIRNVFNTRPEKTIYFENIVSEDTELKELFRSLKAVLITKLNIQDTIVGFIIFAEKKSGNNYNEKDIQFIETAADSIAIATQNALRYEEIAAFNFNLQKKINSATADLRKTNEKLKALDEAKDEFISMASHQLRTPLTSVKGYLSMVLEGDAGPINDLQRKFLSQSFISSQRMVFLISDLLNASRLKTGKFVIESQKTYLPDVVEEELKQLEETVKARGLILEFNKPKDFPFVNIDENKIRQVIMNFADNAIYYTPAGGKIEVNLRATKDVIEYTVKDSGMGVPKADQKHLFTKFYRASNAKKARPDGTGLGIFMAKKVIIAQGGALIFKSLEGKGSTFGFSIPLKKIEIQ